MALWVIYFFLFINEGFVYWCMKFELSVLLPVLSIGSNLKRQYVELVLLSLLELHRH